MTSSTPSSSSPQSPVSSTGNSSSTRKMINVTVTPPSPVYYLKLPTGAVPTGTSPNNKKQALLKRFRHESANFNTLKHSIHTSPSNAHPEESILLELEQLKVWTSRVFAFISSTLDDKHQHQDTLDIVDEGNVSISNRIDHIESRIRTLSPPSSPIVLLPLKRKKQQPPPPPKNKKIRLRDEKQARDCLRRVVIRFYLRDYLGMQFDHTIPTTFTCASNFIANNKQHFANRIYTFGLRIFKDAPFTADNEYLVHLFIKHCQDEMLQIMLYLITLLKRDANEFNYDNSRFDGVPSILMDKIRIRLIKDPNYSFDASNQEYINASKTSLRVFQTITSAVNSDADTDTDIENDEDDHDMLVIDE